METGSVREERDSQSEPAGAERRGDVGPVSDLIIPSMVYTDSTVEEMTERVAVLDNRLQKKREALAQMQHRKEELTKKKKEQDELHLRYCMFFETEKAKDYIAVKRTKKQREDLQKRVEKLEEERAALMKKKQRRQRQVKSHKKYEDYMEQVAKMTEFENVETLTLRLENQLHVRDKLSQKNIEIEEQAGQCRKTLWLLEDQSNLLQLQKTCKLTRLQNELETTSSENRKWEKQSKQISEVTAKKALQLGKIKMATLNLYEKTQGVAEAKVDDMNDTEKQLDEIKIWIQNHNSTGPHEDPNHKDGEQKRKEKRGAKAKDSRVHKKQ